MVVKMMKWTPWAAAAGVSSSSSTRKFEARIKVEKVEGVKKDAEKKRFWVEIKWKGQKKNNIGLRNLRRSVKRNFTTEEGGFSGERVFEWNQQFSTLCNFSGFKDPWDVTFSVFTGLSQEQRNTFLVGTATLNVAEFASIATEKDFQINLPLSIPSITTQDTPMLCLSLGLTELGTLPTMSRSIHPVSSSPSSEGGGPPLPPRKHERSAGLKVKLIRGTKKVFRNKSSGSEDVETSSALDTDSLDDDFDGTSEDSNMDSDTQLSVNYETLAYANFARGSLHSGWIYYNDRTPSRVEYPTAPVSEPPLKESSKQRILAWRRRKLNFRSSKPKVEGEPLLKKDYGEAGGDDIDFDRRQLSSSDESSLGWSKAEEGSTTSRSSFSEFGDDNFVVGSWERKEILSRDGHMKLQAQVFFASIDQRSERAAGESACTTLVDVIANWLQSNRYEVPIKSVFDGLIRDGSLEWRKLCENEEYQQRFPDKHFDLETVLEAKIRPLSVIAEKSFIGFFHPEGMEGDFDFLHGAMSFDNIWEEISRNGQNLSNNGDPLVYIVSWNDHFFVLRVEADAYYIIDTLGERLYEGCNQAYILKFDKNTSISRLPTESKGLLPSKKKSSGEQVKVNNEEVKSEAKEEIVCKGKESCKEYIKSFLAAIPIREMQADIKKGLMSASIPIHHRLQIEFHYTTQLTHSASSECS